MEILLLLSEEKEHQCIKINFNRTEIPLDNEVLPSGSTIFYG